MKQPFIYCCLVIYLFIAGANAVKADEYLPNWVTIQDQKAKVEASFPRHPNHMQFDLPLENTNQMGDLDVYSAPVNKELYMLSTLSYPFFTGHELEPSQFQKIFYSFIIQRMFYYPQAFKDHQTFRSEQTTWQGYPAIHFSLSYQDKGATKILCGLAVLRQHKLYTLFCLTRKDEFKEELAQHFVESLHLL